MAFEISRRITPRQIQPIKRNIPVEQIIAVQGQNPLAMGIEATGNAVGQALTKRAELRRQGEQLALAGKLTGQEITPEMQNSGLSADQLVKLLEAKSTMEKNSLERAQALAKMKADAKSPPANKKNFIGNDAQGNPLFADQEGNISQGVVPTGGSVFPKNQPQKTQNALKDLDEQTDQIGSLRKMLSDIPGGFTGGAESLLSKATFGAIGGKAKQYNDLKPSIATKIYRAMTGDTRLSDADAASRAYPLLPSLAEPLDVREEKLRNIENIIAQRKEIVSSGGGLKTIEPKKPTTITPKKIGRFQVEVE